MKNIIFDFGNVLVRWTPEDVYTSFFGDEHKAWYFLRHVADATWRSRIDAGEPTDRLIAELKQQFPDFSEAIDLYKTRWQEMLPGEVDGMSALLSRLQRLPGVSLFGLTNWSMETFPSARLRFPILQKIDHYVVSGAEGLVKPDPRLFQLLLSRFNLRAEDCIFIDDNEANVLSATALGMQGIHFHDAVSLERRLNALLLKEAFAADHFSALTGVSVEEVSADEAVCTLAVSDRHCNARGTAMGGAIFTLSDFAAAVAANGCILLEQGTVPYVSLESSIHFLSPAPIGKTIEARCQTVRRGRSTALFHVEIKSPESGKLLATIETLMMRNT